MSNLMRARGREMRRPTILEGIRRNLKHTEIAAQLKVNRWVVMNDLRFMKFNRDPEFEQAQKAQERIRAEERQVSTREKNHVKHNERFLDMTGMTLQEKSFRNMIDFHKQDLMKILKSEDQNAAIMELPKNVRRPLVHNGIITKGWHYREITSPALKYLTNT